MFMSYSTLLMMVDDGGATVVAAGGPIGTGMMTADAIVSQKEVSSAKVAYRNFFVIQYPASPE